MTSEHERIVLTEPLAAEGLVAGDVGTVVHVYPDGKVYEVEFTTLAGSTVAVAMVAATSLRPVTGREITHARPDTGQLTGAAPVGVSVCRCDQAPRE